MEQTLVCRKCGKDCGHRRAMLGYVKQRILVKSCDQCRADSKTKMRALMAERNRSPKMRALSSKRMRRLNPMHDARVALRVAETNREAYRTGQRRSSFCDPETKSKAEDGSRRFWGSERSRELKERFRKRMSRSNPMFDPQTVERVQATLRDGRSSGRIITPRGKLHWLWKGNRSFNLVVRSRLYKVWTIPAVVRDGFACVLCGRGQCSLQVHHLKPLSVIIGAVLAREGVLDVESLAGSERYSQLADLVVSEHRLEDGITVCRRCHASIDRQYRGHEMLNQDRLSNGMQAVRQRTS
jgi:hypothetical protein